VEKIFIQNGTSLRFIPSYLSKKNILEEVFMRIVTKSLLVFGVVLFLLSVSTAAAQSTGTLKGTVLDSVEKFPLPTVRISLKGTNILGTTDAEGNFTIMNIPAGTYSVIFEFSGYLTQEKKDVAIAAGETTELQIGLKMGFSHEMTVTARREITSLQKVPLNIEVLTTTEMEEAPTINVVQALNNVSGVDVETSQSLTGIGTFMSINGYDDVYIKKMVDGVDITSNITNWSMLNAYPTEMLSQVEVIKGGSSSLWGANMGGIINVITKRPQDLDRPIYSLKGTFGSFGAMDFGEASGIGQSGQIYNFSGTAVGKVDKFGYLLGYKNDNNDGFTDRGKEKNYNIFGKIGYDFSDSTYADFLYSYNKQNMRQHMFLKTDLFLPFYEYYWNYYDRAHAATQVASLKLSSRVAPALNLETQLKYTRSQMEFQREGEASSLTDVEGLITSFDSKESRTGFTLKGDYNPSESFSLVSGVDYYRIMADFSDYIEGQPIIYVNQWAPFANMEYRIGGLGIHVGARYDYDSSFGNQLSPSFGLNWNFMKATLIRFNIGRTFKVPDLWYTIGESYLDLILPNPDLLPERAWAYSVGFESQELEYVWVKVSLYYHDMTDGIVTVPSTESPGRLTWANSTKFVRKGYEAELGVVTPWGITGYIGTNYNDHTNETSATPITWIPTRTYKTRLQYQNDKWNFLAHLQGRWIWWNEEGETAELFLPHDKRWVFDLRVTKGFLFSENINLNLVLDVFNITDTLYWDRLDSPNPRRWWQLGFELKFK
jgi:outer membrane receptor protein involved in Fe transport